MEMYFLVRWVREIVHKLDLLSALMDDHMGPPIHAATKEERQEMNKIIINLTINLY